MTSYYSWADYGPDGVSPDQLELTYDPSRRYELSERLDSTLTEIWEEMVARNPKLHDPPCLNLVYMEENKRRAVLGPTRFRDYSVVRLCNSNDNFLDEDRLSDDDLKWLQEEVSIVSSFCACIADDSLILGFRSHSGDLLDGRASFPGSGYLDLNEDSYGGQEMKPTRDIITREIGEELNVQNKLDSISCLGIFDEFENGASINPAIFSVVELDCSPNHVREQMEDAEDRWEFASLFWVNLQDSVAYERFVSNALDGSLVHVQPEEKRGVSTQFTDKARLMLPLVGRYRYGDDWFSSLLHNFYNKINII